MSSYGAIVEANHRAYEQTTKHVIEYLKDKGAMTTKRCFRHPLVPLCLDPESNTWFCKTCDEWVDPPSNHDTSNPDKRFYKPSGKFVRYEYDLLDVAQDL